MLGPVLRFGLLVGIALPAGLGPGLGACARPTAAPARTTFSPAERLVVVVSVDGLPAYALRDPLVAAPTLRRLVREGATTSEGMRAINPTVTWPNHTTMATGVTAIKHGVLFNGRLVRPGPRLPVRVEYRERADLVRVPTLYDLADESGLRTAQVGWIPNQIGGTITWGFPERPQIEATLEREMVAAGFLETKQLVDFREGPIAWRDQVWADAASYIVTRYRPNLLYFHLLNLDATHHRYAPRTMAGAGAIALADARIRELLDVIEHAGLMGRATVFVVSDHGFREVYRQIRANVALRAAGLIETSGVACDAWVVSAGGIAMVYVTNPERRAEIAAHAKAVLGGVEGIQHVVEPGQFAALGLPLPEANDQMGDLVLVAWPGYAFADGLDGDPVRVLPDGAAVGTHGYVASDPDMNATFIAWGYGIRPGVRLPGVNNVDVAPTVGALLGLTLPGSDGRVLREMLVTRGP